MEKFIKVQDRGTTLEISYQDMIKYHGRFNIGGVALAFQTLDYGLSKLLPDGQIPDRYKISYNSALGETATGVVDGVEMAARALTRGCLSTDMDCGSEVDAPANPDGGKFYFEVIYDGSKLGLALKKGLIPAEFTAILKTAMERKLNQEEIKRLQEIKEEIAHAVISAKAEDLFNLHYFA